MAPLRLLCLTLSRSRRLLSLTPPRSSSALWCLQQRLWQEHSGAFLHFAAAPISIPITAQQLHDIKRVDAQFASTILSTSRLRLCNRTYRTDSACHCNCLTLPALTSSTPTTTRLITTPTKQSLDHICCQTQLRNCHQSQRHMPRSVYRGPVMDAPAGLFRGELDRYNGITVASKSEYDETTDFVDKLQKSLAYWLKKERRAIWFLIANEHASWIPTLTQNGFTFHHVHDGAVALYRWLPGDDSNVPPFCHTMVGVGGLVVNDNNEILVVNERWSVIPSSWKLPGGYVNPGEDFIQAAMREVLEETNIQCTFRTLIAIRHSHGGNFGCSDMYIVVALKPITTEIKMCEREIAKAQWMPITEYLEHKNVHETNRQFVRLYLDYKKRGLQFTCERATHQVLKKEYNMYYLKCENDEAAKKTAETCKARK